MEPQRRQSFDVRDAATLQIDLRNRTFDRLRDREQASCRFLGAVRSRSRRVLWSRQAEKRARFVENIAQAIEASIARDEIEQIAMFARRRVGPFAGGTSARVGTSETDEQAAAWLVGDIAHLPITALAAAIGKIVTADGFGILGQELRQSSGGAEGSHVTPPRGQ